MYASLCFLFFGASRVYFLYASGCLLASLFLIQFFCVYLSKKNFVFSMGDGIRVRF